MLDVWRLMVDQHSWFMIELSSGDLDRIEGSFSSCCEMREAAKAGALVGKGVLMWGATLLRSVRDGA